MNKMNKIPGFNAVSSLYRPTRSYRTGTSGIPSAISSSVMPQQALRSRFGGFGGGFGTILGGRLSGGVTAFTCSGLLCTCTGDSDCNDMFSTNVCGDIASCDEGGCRCLRI